MFSNVTKILAGQTLHSLLEKFLFFSFFFFSFLLTLVSLVCVYICVFKFGAYVCSGVTGSIHHTSAIVYFSAFLLILLLFVFFIYFHFIYS